ncbi:hypothetical protein B4080_3121 [Bacillus cereus]|nr:hypothetical protein B4080_3121 [Bacillus cereus]
MCDLVPLLHSPLTGMGEVEAEAIIVSTGAIAKLLGISG